MGLLARLAGAEEDRTNLLGLSSRRVLPRDIAREVDRQCAVAWGAGEVLATDLRVLDAVGEIATLVVERAQARAEAAAARLPAVELRDGTDSIAAVVNTVAQRKVAEFGGM